MSSPIAVAAQGHALGRTLPAWSVVPFALMLLAIAIAPLVAPRLWERNRGKAALSLVLGAPVAIWIARLEPGLLLHTAHEYASFVVLLGGLFVVSGGIVVRGTLSGTPRLNVALLGMGALLASVVGTTGASMLLIRPVLRANSIRVRNAHVVVFFVFLVSNMGGLLTPLGDPPLFLGFLRGVPFLWTLRLWGEWLFANGVVLAIFYAVDSAIFRREDIETPGELDEIAVAHEVPVHVVGLENLAYLAGVVGMIAAAGALRPLPPLVAEAGILAMAALSWVRTPKLLRAENGFSWGPMVEVAVLFAGIFATMIPALAILNARGGELGLREPWQFFWASGALSSFLDNAPAYLSFASAASGVAGTDAANLAELVATRHGEGLLTAVSLGCVLMGANTYLGNGPNFMVKAIAEQSGVRMPGFLGYMGWSAAVLLPVFAALTLLFLS